MGVNNTRLPMGGGVRPASYQPPAGTASGIPGAAYPVLGSAPVTNMQPRYGNPGAAQMRPGLAQPPLSGTGQPPLSAAASQMGGANPQQLATALSQIRGSIA